MNHDHRVIDIESRRREKIAAIEAWKRAYGHTFDAPQQQKTTPGGVGKWFLSNLDGILCVILLAAIARAVLRSF